MQIKKLEGKLAQYLQHNTNLETKFFLEKIKNSLGKKGNSFQENCNKELLTQIKKQNMINNAIKSYNKKIKISKEYLTRTY